MSCRELEFQFLEVFQRTQDFPLGLNVPHSTIPTHHRLGIQHTCYMNVQQNSTVTPSTL